MQRSIGGYLLLVVFLLFFSNFSTGGIPTFLYYIPGAVVATFILRWHFARQDAKAEVARTFD